MTVVKDILRLDAVEQRDRLAKGALRAVELAEAYLEETARREPEVGAWAWLDGDYVMQQAQKLDEYRATGRAVGPLHGLPVGLKDIIDTEGTPTENGTVLDAGRKPSADAYVVKRLKQAKALDDFRAKGRPTGPLHGLPVGLKDIIDTAGVPTENGTVLDAGRKPQEDAYVVRRLKQAGAVIMGKTVTTELALRTPGKTRNPHNPAHTPGGSSSGSAAAVAAGMVPLALGTQTVGSMIRPASYCGVVGFKPSFGAIPRSGVLSQSPSLDTLGVFAGSVGAAAMLADCLFGHDPGDPATGLLPAPRLQEIAAAKPPVPPVFAFVRQPAWDGAAPEMQEGFGELNEALGDQCDEVELPGVFGDALGYAELVQLAELSKAYDHYARRGRDKLSAEMQKALDTGNRIPAHDYLAALDWPRLLNDALEAVFNRYDAILTPAAPGPAPLGLESTGSPAFNGIWTFCGLPAVTLPLLQTESGLPMGVQLVGRRGDDARLLRSAQWLVHFLAETA